MAHPQKVQQQSKPTKPVVGALFGQNKAQPKQPVAENEGWISTDEDENAAE